MLSTTFVREAIASSEAASLDVGGDRLRRARRRARRATRCDLLGVAARRRPLEAVGLGPLGQVGADAAPGDAGGAEDDDREVPAPSARPAAGGRRGGLGLAEAVAAGRGGAGRLVDAVDDVAGVGDAGEDEVVVVGGGGVEVDVADLHHPLVDATGW